MSFFNANFLFFDKIKLELFLKYQLLNENKLNIIINRRPMSSYFFERSEVHCNCFDNSPKNAPKIFRTDPNYSIATQNKQTKHLLARNLSQHGKTKKKSLKKERNPSLTGSQKDPKQKQESNHNLLIPDIHTNLSSSQPKKQQRITVSDHFEQPLIEQIKTERSKPSHIIRSQRPHVFYEPVKFQPNYKIAIPSISVQNYSQQRFLSDFEYDRQITHQFEKDFRQFKLQMDMIEPKTSQRSIKHKNKEFNPSIHKMTAEIHEYRQNQPRIRYPVTEHIILIPQKHTPQRTTSFKNSAVSDRQKSSIKKQKNKMFPKQIESEKGSCSGSSSGRESVFLGRGFDGLTQKRESFEEIEMKGKDQRGNLQTMVTQESNIKNSQIKTMTEYSHNLTSPKSQQNLGMAFGGGNKYGVAGMSYQDIGEIRGPKLNSLKKLYL